jgi:hypothetical protein
VPGKSLCMYGKSVVDMDLDRFYAKILAPYPSRYVIKWTSEASLGSSTRFLFETFIGLAVGT